MASQSVLPMNRRAPKKSLPRLRRYLLAWFGGSAIVMVIVYTQLLEYYLETGINLRTESFIEQTADAYLQFPDERAELLSRSNMAVYADLQDLPEPISQTFPIDQVRPGETIRFNNLDFDNDDGAVPVDTSELCARSNCDLLYLYEHIVGPNSTLLFLHGIVGSDRIYRELELTEQVAVVIGSLFFLLFLVGALLGIRSIDGPLQRLDRWSAALGQQDKELPIPPLRFQELDTLAQRLKFAFERMQEGVNKEKSFVRHASHELRTPITILSSNVELLDRLTDKSGRSEAEKSAFLRQYRALDDIQLLIDTLLWVNRQSDHQPRTGTVDLKSEVERIAADHRYLVDAKNLSLTINGAGELTNVPIAAVRIVLSNLLKNAFQYTVEGDITIAIEATSVAIENTSAAPPGNEPHHETDDEYGFGLGLELVLLLCKRFNWLCTTTDLNQGRVTTVSFG